MSGVVNALVQIQLRQATNAQWTSTNPILAPGEPGYATDTQTLKIGDGHSHWTELGVAFPTVDTGYHAFGTVSGALNVDGRIGVNSMDLSAAATITLTNGSDGQVTAIDIIPHNFDFTIAGTTFTAIDTRVVITALFSRGAWIVLQAGGGAGTGLPTVSAAGPTFNDASGTSSDTYTIPTSPHVSYKVGGTTKTAGTYSVTAGATVTVTATADAGYSLIGTASWTYTFSTSSTLTWSTYANDTLTATDGTGINGRTTPVGAKTWTVVTNGTATDLFINSNKTNWSENAVRATASLLNTAATRANPIDARVTVNYDLTVNPAGAIPTVIAFGSWDYSSGDTSQLCGVILELSGGGTTADLTQFRDNYSGSAATQTIAPGKALTGQPLTGKLAWETSGDIGRAYINDVLIVSWQWTGSNNVNTKMGFQFRNRYPIVLDCLVEVYT